MPICSQAQTERDARITQYFAGSEFVVEIVTNPRGAKTFGGSMLHAKEQKPGTRLTPSCDSAKVLPTGGYRSCASLMKSSHFFLPAARCSSVIAGKAIF